MKHHPVGYSIVDHAGEIFRSAGYRDLAKKLSLSPEELQIHVVEELKAVVAEQRDEELRDYKQIIGVRALTRATEKLVKKDAA